MAEHGRKPSGSKPSGSKPSGSKPSGSKPSGSKPSGGRPSSGKPSAGKPGASRPGKPGEKPRSGGRPTGKPASRDGRDARGAGKPGGSRPGTPGDKPRSGGRPAGKPGERRDGRTPRRDDRRPDTRSSASRSASRSDSASRSSSASRDGRSERPRDPHLGDDILASDLDRGTLNELRTLPDPLAELIARHLVAAERALIADDPKKALEHIEAARRRASRIAAVREAAGVTNYHAGNYAEALAELRAAKRMTGSPAYVPMMADCERGLGRPQKALDLLRTLDPKSVDVETRVEGLIVAAGARADMGKPDVAVVTLQVPELTRLKPGTPRARLQYAYAEFLLAAGRLNEANEWMQRAAGSDIDGVTDADERADEFAGIALGTEE